MDLDLLDCFGRKKKTLSYNQRNTVTSDCSSLFLITTTLMWQFISGATMHTELKFSQKLLLPPQLRYCVTKLDNTGVF